jgi:hypothetical protein
MAIGEFGFQPIIGGASLPPDQVGPFLMTSPESYRPEALPEWAYNRNAAALPIHQRLEHSCQNHLEKTNNVSVVADPLPSNMDPAEELQEDLHFAMKRPLTDDYIPNNELKRLTSNDTFERVVRDIASGFSALPEEREGFAVKLLGDCRILVAIFIHGNLCRGLLQTLVRRGITDEHLPFKPECFDWLMTRRHQTFYKTLYINQWRFKAAVFHTIGQRQKLDEGTIVPFLSKKWEGKGGFSIVWKVRLEPSHQSVYSLPGVCIAFQYVAYSV